jgi:hypothetical protein
LGSNDHPIKTLQTLQQYNRIEINVAGKFKNMKSEKMEAEGDEQSRMGNSSSWRKGSQRAVVQRIE